MNPLTVNGPIPFGWHRDDSVAQAEVRRRCVLIVGATDSGKTNTLQNFNASLLRCPDVLVFHIDLSGARMSRPWVNPWLNGKMQRPVVDWVASTTEEALLMTEFTIQVMQQRAAVYQDLMWEEDTDIVPLTHSLPGIYLFVDESKKASGVNANQRLANNLTVINEEGRAVGARLVVSGLRATSTVLPTDALRQMGIRVGMQVNDEEDINHLFGWKYRPNPADTPYPGCGLWRNGLSGQIRPFRTYDLTQPSSIASVARACERLRPALDEPSLDVPLRREYLSRWDRVVPQLTKGSRPGSTPSSRELVSGSRTGSPGSSPTPLVSGSTSSSTVSRESASVIGPGVPTDMAKKLAAVDQAIAKARLELATERLRSMPAEVVDARWAEIAERLGGGRATGTTVPDDSGPGRVAGPRARMMQHLDAAGPTGLPGTRLVELLAADGLATPQATVYTWLKADAVKAGYGAWVHPRHRQDGA